MESNVPHVELHGRKSDCKMDCGSYENTQEIWNVNVAKCVSREMSMSF